MTFYSGVKSLDAEIIVDFIRGDIHMDYSLNSLGSLYNSNTSMVLGSEWAGKSFLVKMQYILWGTLLILATPTMVWYVPLSTFLFNKGFVKSPEAQYDHQNFMRWFWTNYRGIYERKMEGVLKDTILEFKLPHNLYVEYELEGDYQNKIKSVSLLRNFLRHKKFGTFWETRQDGWKLIFEFVDIPQWGSCIVRDV